MESFRVQWDNLRSSSSLMVKGQGLTQLGRFPCIAVIYASKLTCFGGTVQSQHLAFVLLSLWFLWVVNTTVGLSTS